MKSALARVLQRPHQPPCPLVSIKSRARTPPPSGRVVQSRRTSRGSRSGIHWPCPRRSVGPDAGPDPPGLDRLDAEQGTRVGQYGAFLATAVVDIVIAAAGRLEPVERAWAPGRADFAVNRRNNKEADVPALRSR